MTKLGKSTIPRHPLFRDRKSTRLNSSHRTISYAVFCLKKKKRKRKHEGFRDRLNGERHGAVADLVDVAIDCDDANAEMRRIGALHLGDVIGDRFGMVLS